MDGVTFWYFMHYLGILMLGMLCGMLVMAVMDEWKKNAPEDDEDNEMEIEGPR